MRWGTTQNHHPKTVVIEAIVGREVGTDGRAREVQIVVPRPAAQDARIIAVIYRGIAWVIVFIQTPFPHIATHIDTTIRAISLR